jgi:methyl-accepting chemotaxis protein
MINDLFTTKNSKEIVKLNAMSVLKAKEIAEQQQFIGELQSREDGLLSIKSAMEGSSAAIMMVNRDFIITYVNQASIDLFRDNAAEFKAAFPLFEPEKMIGSCIDVFHKNPQHQRQMLANTALLPFKTDIKVGQLTIALYVTATYCKKGLYAGNVLEWRNVSAERRKAAEDADAVGQLAAINNLQGVVEVGLDGTILKANEIYLKMLGFSEAELVGQHMSIVLDPVFAKSAALVSLWDRLLNGGNATGQYKRIAKNGKEVWIQASYNPINDLDGQQYKIINYTIDITEQKLQAADHAGQLAAINKIQGIIEFDLSGKITAVNEIFAEISAYSAAELVGNHHRLLVEPAYSSSDAYKLFWEKLANGEADAGVYKRIGRNGKEVWLQASYNPILDLNGRPFKVVKYATDISQQYNANLSLMVAVDETQTVIEAAKSGDLSRRIDLSGKDGAIASLCAGVNALMDQITEIIVQVHAAGSTINSAAAEIFQGNSDLSSRTEQQASSLEETASSMEQLASAVKQNAQNAKQANQLAASASDVALKGGEIVGNVVKTMSAINQSARKIEDIIAVIDGIAFQTNLLALNAAVEAARAGAHGRGFAVVAGEVRNLALRSANAAKDIKMLITDSVDKTTEGAKQVETAGNTMQEIVSSVQRVTDMMGDIAAASVEQSAGIDQVNHAVTMMDEMTQQNSALVEQASAAAESLLEQAGSLVDTVSAFQLAGTVLSTKNNSVRPSSKSSPVRLAASTKTPVPATRPLAAKKLMTIVSKELAHEADWEEF